MDSIISTGAQPVSQPPASGRAAAAPSQVASIASDTAPPDVTSVSNSALLLAEESAANNALNSIAQSLSLVQVASHTIEQALSLVEQYQAATQAGNSDAQAGAVLAQLQQLSDTTFNGTQVSGYSTTFAQAAGGNASGPSLSVPDLSSLDLSTPSGVEDAIDTLQSADVNAQDFITALQGAGATAETVLNNYLAANSTLDATPIDTQQAQAAQSVPAAVLNLLNQPA